MKTTAILRSKTSNKGIQLKIVDRNPSELKNHLINIRVWGESIDGRFVENIRTHGVKSPLTICKSSNSDLDGVIVKGRRRRYAAMTVGLKTVPCIEWECDDPLLIEQEVLLDNVRNESTIEQQGRMYIELKRIETELAARRRAHDEDSSPKGGDDSRRNATASEAAAASVGMSRKTAELAASALAVADDQREAGNSEVADEIISALNTVSVSAAARKADAATSPPPKESAPENPETKEILKCVSQLKAVFSRAEVLRAGLMNSFDAKNKASRPFQQRFARFEKLMRSLADSLDVAANNFGAVEAAVSATMKQLEGE